MEADADRGARELAAWRRACTRRGRRCRSPTSSRAASSRPHVGDELQLRAYVELDGLAPDDVSVEVVYGRSRTDESIEGVRRTPLEPDPTAATDAASGPHGPRLYTGTVVLDRAGAFGYTVRVVPRHPLLASPAELGLVALAG